MAGELVQTMVGQVPIEMLEYRTEFKHEGRALVAERKWLLCVRRDALRWDDVVTDDGMVVTAVGPLPFAQLEMKEVRSQGDNDVSVGVEWYHEGQLVRRDAWVTALRPAEAQPAVAGE